MNSQRMPLPSRALLAAALAAALAALGACSSEAKKEDPPAPPPPNCEAGTLDCACRDGQRCDGLLACSDNVCKLPKLAMIAVDAAEVRSCDLLFEEAGRAIVSARFGEESVGEQSRRGRRVAVSFAMKVDGAPGAKTVALGLAGSDEPTVNPPKLVAAQCFDRGGAPVATPGVHF